MFLTIMQENMGWISQHFYNKFREYVCTQASVGLFYYYISHLKPNISYTSTTTTTAAAAATVD
jgi:hypothetical protein